LFPTGSFVSDPDLFRLVNRDSDPGKGFSMVLKGWMKFGRPSKRLISEYKGVGRALMWIGVALMPIQIRIQILPYSQCCVHISFGSESADL
jgi:hypothetical protein